MKKHIKTYLSIILALSMLLSMLPIYAAATDDEFEGLEIVEEIPFEFELEPGDLPLDMLADAVLPAADLPSYISASLAAERDHVNRLYLQEPDANTVMFQNRDGSKTIYVFSKPVKNTGLTLGTNALAVNGGKIAFSGNNIITNRIGLNAAGKQIQDYKIGYSDIQTLPGGVLTANGIDITEDVRNWAVSEFGAADAEYTISDSASAAYTASVSVIETELMANVGASASANAVTPGITITPINPSPATGATVMSITYSDLAGKMCFKNAETNKYLTLHPTTKNSLITANNIYGVFSYWIVKFVGTNKYTICSYYDRTNKYLGVDYDNYELDLGSILVLEEYSQFEISITSSVNSTIEIKPYYDSHYAISSDCCLVEGDESDEFPDSCSWIITNRSDYVEVQSITPQSTTRIEQAGEDFYPEYTTVPSNATDTDIRLYYSDNNQEVSYDPDAEEMGEVIYNISNAGIYTVYYKDTVTGVRSANFTLVIYDVPNFEIENSNAEATFSIQPAYAQSKYLTMHVSDSGVTSLKVENYDIQERAFTGEHATYYNEYENWKQLSRAFTVESINANGNKFRVASILTRTQYASDLPSQWSIGASSYTGSNYVLTDRDNKPNTIKVTSELIEEVLHHTVACATPTSNGSDLTILKIGDYYLIFATSVDSDNILSNPALKYDEVNNNIVAEPFNPTDTSFLWTIDQLGVNAPLIRQTERYTCGPATFLQVLYGANIGSQVEAYSIDSEKGLHSQMMTLKYNVLQYVPHPDGSGGTSQESFTDRINNYSLFDNNAVGSYHRWQKTSAGTNGMGNVKQYISNSLKKGWAPFFMTDSGGAPYRFDEGGGMHYICIIGYEEYIDNDGNLDAYVIVSNCHYITSLNSIFAIPYDEFYSHCDELFYYEEPSSN